MHFAVKLEANIVNAVHCLSWVSVLSAPHIAAMLSRPIPVQLIRDLLDAYASYAGGDLIVPLENGMRMDYDPIGAHKRTRPFILLLRVRLEGRILEVPIPADIVDIARQALEARGSPLVHKWDTYEPEPDFEHYLLWPEALEK